MLKNLTSGAIINYGATLPDPSTAFDGALFFKNAGSQQGLYMFGFNQDANASSVGDQSAQGWYQATSSDVFVAKAGDTMTGDLTIISGGPLRGLRVAGQNGSAGSFTANSGVNQGATLSGELGPITFVAGNTQRMSLSAAGVLSITTGGNTGTVWHSANDGAGSGLDADLLDGQDSTYFANASNLSAGTLNVARLPFIPVQRGGVSGMNSSKINIGWNGTNTMLVSIDGAAATGTWPINISGNAGYAASAGNASTAGSATDAVNAQRLRSGGGAGTTAMTFNWSGQGGQPTYLWGGNDGSNMYVYNPSNFSVNYAGSANYSNSSGTANNANAVNGISGWSYNNRNYNAQYLWASQGSPADQFLVTPANLSVAYANSSGITGGMIEAIFGNVSCAVLTAALYRCGVLGGGPGGGPVGG